jgi:hypothetical protein
LQAKEWVKDIGFLKYVLMHPHLYDMPLLRTIQGKSWLACIHPLLRTCLVHLVIPLVLGSFMKIKWIWCLYVPLLLLCLTWSSSTISHVGGLVNLVFKSRKWAKSV